MPWCIPKDAYTPLKMAVFCGFQGRLKENCKKCLTGREVGHRSHLTAAAGHTERQRGKRKSGARVALLKEGWPRRRFLTLFDIVGQDEGTCGRRLRVRMFSRHPILG